MPATSIEPDLSDRSPSPGRLAWLIVAMLVPVALLNYLDRQMLAVMKTSLMTDIPDIGTRENWGFMLGSFKWVYAVLSPVGGFVADRFGRRPVIVASLFVWSAVTWMTGYVTDFHTLVGTRALMGISEAFYIPAALALITDHHRGETRSRAVGVHQTGIYAGVIIGGFMGHVADAPDLGWRLAFKVCGLIGVVYALPLMMVLRDPPEAADAATRAHHRASPWVMASDLLRNRNFLLLTACFTLPALAGWIVRDWMPDIIKERYHLPQGSAGVYSVLPVQIASVIGVLLGGWLADALMRRTAKGRILVSAGGMLLFLPALFGVGFSEHLWLAVGFLVVYGIGWGCFDCNNMPILSQIAPADRRATGYGIMNLASISCGGFADWGFGFLRDRDVPLAMIFGVFAMIALLSAVLMLMIRPDPNLVEQAEPPE